MLPKFLEVAAELDEAATRMRELKFSEADIEDELERIRARHTRTPNPHEEAARQAKAQRIALVIWRGLDDAARRDVRTGWLLHEASRSFQNQFARLAGLVTGCSDECWRRTVQLVCEMVTAERRNLPAACILCDGKERGYQTEETATCPRCRGALQEPCANCGEAPATVVVPLGHYCAACAQAS